MEDVFDPKTNVREAVKQMLLLEDHLFQESKRCPDCIRKHLLAIEAYGDECVTLDKDGESREVCVDFASASRDWLGRLAGGEDPAAVAQDVRALRKQVSRSIRSIPLVPTGSEVRAFANRHRGIIAAAAGFFLGRLTK